MAYNDISRGLFQGILSLAPRDFNSNRTGGYKDLGQVDLFTIDPKPKFEDIMDSRTSPAGTIDHILTEIDFTAKIKMLDIAMYNWAFANYGEWSGAVDAATGATETITLYNGTKTHLAHPGVTNVVISGATLTTDYTLNAASGTINVVVGSTAVPVGTPLTTTVTYDYAAYNGAVEAFTIPQKYFSLHLEGINVAQGGQPVVVDVWQWAPDPVAMLNFIDKKHFAQECSGKMLKDESITTTGLSAYYKVKKA
jgi:hypothetical protein